MSLETPIAFDFVRDAIAAGQDPLTEPQLYLVQIPRSDFEMLRNMSVHYSEPMGFVGRSICYAIICGGMCYGSIAGGSATRYLPGREIVGKLNNGVNNIFFHVEKRDGRYPLRNFTSQVLRLYRETIEKHWWNKFKDEVLWHETLVEPPRTGECYKRDGWKLVGTTKGFTCKRVSGKGTDSWTGKRVWDTKNLRPKLVFVHEVTQLCYMCGQKLTVCNSTKHAVYPDDDGEKHLCDFCYESTTLSKLRQVIE